MTREEHRNEWWAFFATLPLVTWRTWRPETHPRSVVEFIGWMIPHCLVAALFVKAWFRVWRSLTMRDVPVPEGMGIVRRAARVLWVVVAYLITFLSWASFYVFRPFRFALALWVTLTVFVVIAVVARRRRGVTDSRS